MAEVPSGDLATKEEVLVVLKKSVREVLERRRDEVRLIHQDSERLLSEPQRIFTTEGPRCVSGVLRGTALAALQDELGMGKMVSQEIKSRRRIFGPSQTVRRVTFETGFPKIVIVQVTLWERGCEQPSSVSWYLTRTDISPLSRLWRRFMNRRPA